MLVLMMFLLTGRLSLRRSFRPSMVSTLPLHLPHQCDCSNTLTHHIDQYGACRMGRD